MIEFMKPLIVLFLLFGSSILILKLIGSKNGFLLSGRIALSGMLVFTGIGHFLFTDGMSLMLPEWIPLRRAWIYTTGLFEIALAVILLIKRYRRCVGIMLLVFLILILPANIYAAFTRLDYQTATYTGPGLVYLWYRIPFQMLLWAWTYHFTVRR